MKLLYLYVRQFKCLKNREFNFDSNIRFHYDVGTGKVDCEERHVVPEAFWTSDDSKSFRHDKVPVEAVSAIIGENGTGKTSIAALLHDLLSGSRYDEENEAEGVNAILILLQENKLLVKISGHHAPSVEALFSNRKVSINGNDLVIRQVDKQEVDMIYYSPVFSVTRDEGKAEWNVRDRFFDISTTGLLRSAIRDGFVRKTDPVKLYAENEIRLVLEFLWRLQKRRIGPNAFPQPLPRVVAIDPIDPALENAKKTFYQYAGLVKKDKRVNQIKSALSRQFSRLLELPRPVGSPLVALFYAFGVQYLAGLLIFSMGQLRRMSDVFANELFRVLEEVSDNAKDVAKRHAAIIRFMMSNFHPTLSIQGKLLKTKPPLKAVFSTIAKLLDGNYEKDRILVEQGTNRWEDMMKLVRLHRKCLDCGFFLSFSFPFAISSGELSFLSMFGRLSERFNELSRARNKKRMAAEVAQNKPSVPDDRVHAVVFLDEAETSLHPEWQRKLVSHLIVFLEKMHPQVRVHLVFASHSPILLSDIPKENAVFLFPQSEKNDSCEIIETNSEDEWGQTFGANIFDLYRYPFVLRDGPCGEFAKRVIDRALLTCNKRMNTKDGKQIRETTNEFKQIEQLIDLVGDPTIQAYIENTMDWMPPHNIKLDH